MSRRKKLTGQVGWRQRELTKFKLATKHEGILQMYQKYSLQYNPHPWINLELVTEESIEEVQAEV